MLLDSLDKSCFYLVNHGMKNWFFDILMPFVTHFSNWIIPITLAFAFLAYKDWRKALKLAAFMTTSVVVSDLINSHLIKELIARPRPCVALPDVHLLASLKHTWSFPSSHATNTACASTCLYLLYYPYTWCIVLPVILVTLLVGFSRIYIGVHYPLDILAGYVVGFLVAILFFRLIRFLLTVFRNRLKN